MRGRYTIISSALLALMLLAGCAPTTRAARTVPVLPKVDTIEILGMLGAYAGTGLLAPEFEVSGESAAMWLPKIEQAIVLRGLQVVYTDMDGNMGATDGRTAVGIDYRLSINSRVSTLFHEYAHVLGCSGANKDENEVCAETAGYLISASIGLDTQRASFNYLLLRVDQQTRERVLWRDKGKIAGIVATVCQELGAK